MKQFRENISESITLLKAPEYLALLMLFFHYPFRHILVYQEYYWGFSPNIRYATRIIFEVIPLIYLFGKFILEELKPDKGSFYQKLIFLFMVVYCYVVVLLNWNTENEQLHEFNIDNLKYITWFVFCFGCGYYLVKPNEISKFVFIIPLFLVLLQVIIFFDIHTFSINISETYHLSHSVIYLFLGDSLSIWGLISLFFIKTKIWRFVVMVLSLIVLFFLYSRTSFFFFSVVFILFIFKEQRNLFWYGVIAFSLILGFILINPLEWGIQDHRMFKIFSFKDQSMLMRLEIFQNNLPDLQENWFLGDYAGFMRYESNNYMHNYLSFWRNFGFIPFLGFLSLLVQGVIQVYLKIKDKLSINSLYLFSFVMLSILLSRGYYFDSVWLILGCFYGIAHNRTKTNQIR